MHTVVEDEFEGKGIGRKLARGALDQTRADGLKVVATCKFINRLDRQAPRVPGLAGLSLRLSGLDTAVARARKLARARLLDLPRFSATSQARSRAHDKRRPSPS